MSKHRKCFEMFVIYSVVLFCRRSNDRQYNRDTCSDNERQYTYYTSNY